jgi:hypothetical protein
MIRALIQAVNYKKLVVMKHLLTALIVAQVAIPMMADVVYNYNLNSPTVKTVGEYSQINLQKGQIYGNPGQPALPWIASKLMLPLGEEAESVEIKLSAPQTFVMEKMVRPIQPEQPLSSETASEFISPDPQIYTSTNSYPLTPHNGVNTQFLCGHPINFSAVCPFAYYPLSQQLVFYQNVTVVVKTSPTSAAASALDLLKQDAFTAQYLQRSVDNTDQIPMYETRTNGTEYLIIYDTAKLAQWTPFKIFYEGRGYNVTMKPIQEIITEYAGSDTQQKLRSYITYMYTTNSLRHVLLAGDTDVIPHRGFYVNMGQGSEVDADIPADMYYACLDGSWNNDGDNYWGETFEGDLAPEVSIGRFCYNSDTEIANFINKTTMYLDNPVISEVTSALFVGEWLWDGPTWGGDYMDEMIGGSSANGYTTVGVPTSWNISTLYDRTYGYSDAWTAANLYPLLSAGPTLLNHLGHSNTTYNMRMSSNQVNSTNITNNGTNHNFGIYFSQGCYAGAFDNRETNVGQYTSDCIAEKMTSISTAAAAIIAHSRYGWGMQGSTDGASQYIHRQYVDAIFGENIHELGYDLTDSKIDNIPYINNTPVMYWVDYETNLLGDPGMLVWGATPQQINAQLPSYWTVGLNNYQIQTNAPFANLRIKSGSTIIFETTANASGLISINLLNSFVPGDYSLYIIAPDFFAYHTTISVQASNMPYIVATQADFIDQDGLYHTGEIVNVNVTIKNVGLIDQVNPGTITLLSNTPNIQVINATSSFDALAASDSTSINGYFTMRIRGSFDDHSLAYVAFNTQFDTYNANSPFCLELNAPVLAIGGYSFVNTTPLVMPGDNPSVNLIVNNTGSGNAYSPMLLLFANDPGITLSAYEVALSPVGHDTLVNYDSAFSVQVDPSVPVGSLLNIGYMLGAENGDTLEGTFQLYVGLQNYTFEDDMVGWTSSAPLTSFVNQWHRSTARNFTQNGSYSMKFGAISGGDYSSSAYGALVSPEIPLGQNAQLVFHHWMDAETHTNPLYAWDGGMVEISVDGGAWTQITPVGGYPFRIWNNPASPFPANTLVYSGSMDWSEATFDISNYTGTAQFRFLFGSDGSVTGEGWYLDDLHVNSEFVSNGDNEVQTVHFELYDNYPNPFNPTTTIRFDLPESAPVSLVIFNVKGQVVRTLLNTELSKGTHSIIWNGLDDSGRSVSSGVYFYKLNNGTKTLTHRMMLMK